MKPIHIILALLLCVPCVLGVDWNATYNISELPVQDVVSFNFSLMQNESMYFTLVEQDNRSVFNYPSEINFTNETQKELNINYTLPFFADYVGNKTLMYGLFSVSNSVNANVVFLNLTYEILHYPLNTNGTNETPYMTMEDNGKRVVINTFTAISFNQSHEIRVKAPVGSIVNVVCGTYISCPSSILVNESEDVRFDARIYIPEGEPPGNYTSHATVMLGNNTGTVNFSITIRGDDIYNVILYDVWDESCYDTPESLAECYKKQAQYNAQVANALLGRIEEGNVSSFCDETVIVNETIKYVEVGNIDPDLLKSYDQLRTDYNDLTEEYTLVSSKFKKCIDDKGNLEHKVADETEKLSNEFILKRSNLEKEQIEKEEQAKKDLKGRVSWILGLVFLFLCLSLLIGGYMKANWMIKDFPFAIVIGVALFILLCWIAVRIFM